MTTVSFDLPSSCHQVYVEPYSRTLGAVLPDAQTVDLTAGAGTATIEPSTSVYCYRIVELYVEGVTRYVTVPSSVLTLTYDDLEDVDPASFDPDVTPGAVWDLELSALAHPLSTTITYNVDGSVATVTASGVLTEYSYNADGSVAEDSRLGVIRTYTYDVSGNLTGIASD